YLTTIGIRCRYIHSDIDAIERVEIMRDLRLGNFDVLVGVNLLREGLDLPEVSLVAILDADKEGFLRSERSLTQVAGRAARNLNSKVIMYADKITDSMRKTIEETDRRRAKQLKYNEENNITPTAIYKSTESIIGQTVVANSKTTIKQPYIENENINIAADPIIKYMDKNQLKKFISKLKKDMEKAAKELNFIEAAKIRDTLFELHKILDKDK
ncbi:MAG TPA: helicase-related protein, partial [Bacteroidales bacterium]|nr:helicase-related protein [Bacteroidales bacterium]